MRPAAESPDHVVAGRDESAGSARSAESGGQDGLGQGGAFGDCADCGVRHSLPEGAARAHALGVMEEFRRTQRLDYKATEAEADPKLRFESLFAARGNMFGVLECVDRKGSTVFLRAFSSLADGVRKVDGWVMPVLSAVVYNETILPAQAEIKRLTNEIERVSAEAPLERDALTRRRRDVSRDLWDEMCRLYRFRNFRGEERTLRDAVFPGAAITGGMGECCAPKLLQHAALNELRPLSIAEFYWGDPVGLKAYEAEIVEREAGAVQAPSIRKTRLRERERAQVNARRKEVGEFYPSCEARCQPLLGFMLCGVEA
ncbi:MAG: hypothetical protein AB8G23_12480 [Myxococcota bacterium]